MSDDLTTWLRSQIEARRGLARQAIESGACSAEWSELTSGVLVTGPPTRDETWDGTHPIGDSRLTRLIADSDPRDVIARCEAELAILDELSILVLVGIAYPGEAGPESAQHCIRLLGWGYRHRPGYKEEWKP